MKKITFVLLSLLMASINLMAQTTKPETGLVNKTNCGSFWRFDFNYETIDADGETPIVLSAAIFMTNSVYSKTMKAKGCGLLNHYTISDDKSRPTNVSSFATLEGLLSNTNYIIIESDGFGFGVDVKRNQKYLQGRATARVNIDAFIAGRKILDDEGYEYENVVLNLGYSQGGNSGMWVNRLVAEGYRSDELPKIDLCVIGGGPYDMYAHYKKLAEENMTQYPVALPLIMSGMIDAGGYKVKYEDIFNEEFANDLPELFDSKEHDTDYINDYIYENYGSINEKSLALDQIVTPAFFDEENEAMKDIIFHLKENSLVYDAWKPEKTDKISFVHSTEDEVVPVLNMYNMEKHLNDNGYTSYDITYYDGLHTPTGTNYALFAASAIGSFVPAGMEDVFNDTPKENTHDIYSIDGRLLFKNMTVRDAFQSLPKGIYIVNGQKVVKE